MSEPIRILQMIGSLNMGGSQSMIINLYKNIDKSKIQFDFILDHPSDLFYKEVVASMGAKIFEMPTFTGKNILEIKRSWNDFFASHPEYKILHSHVRSYASLYLPIAKKHGVKTIIHSHSTSNGRGISSFVKKVLQYPLRYQADFLMSCSNIAGEWLFGKKATQKDNYIFVPNAIDIDIYKFNESIRNEYRSQLGIEGRFVIGHVGRLHEAKNHMFLLDVFNEVLKIRQDAVLLLVGDGDLNNQIKLRVAELGLEKYVIMLGSRSDVNCLMQAMDVFVFPSLWEGLPVTVVEAQASGLPCLVSDRVTTDVAVSEAVTYLPVDQGTECWVNNALAASGKRFNVIENIKEAGFDVNSSAVELTEFYRSIYE